MSFIKFLKPKTLKVLKPSFVKSLETNLKGKATMLDQLLLQCHVIIFLRTCPPDICTNSPIRSAASPLKPFSSTISLLTSSQELCRTSGDELRKTLRRYEDMKDLVQLVNSTADAPEHIVSYSTDLKYSVQDLSVVHLHRCAS